MNGAFDSKRIAQIQRVLQWRETEDLLEIWRANDPREWTPEAFEAMRRILKERLSEEPSRAETPSERLARAQRLLEQAEQHLNWNEPNEALAACEAALHLAPQLAEAHNWHGLILDELGRPLAAINAYEEAVRLDPSFTSAQDNLREAEREWSEGTNGSSSLVNDIEDEADEYYCSACGAQVSRADRFCPTCGANVEEIEDVTSESGLPSKAVWREFTDLEIAFFAETMRLPEEYAGYLAASDKDDMVIPAREPRVGDLKVRIIHADIIITIGNHTESRFQNVQEAILFIQDVITDKVVFYFGDGEVERYLVDELTESEKMDWGNYVWSGPLRNQQTGIDWYRPPIP